MAAGLIFDRPSSFSYGTDGPVALARIALASDGIVPSKPAIHHQGSFVTVGDLRLPGITDDRAAHQAVAEAVTAGRFPQDLDGDFAVAVWDGARRELRLARDRVGIRPLFYAHTPCRGIAFASFPEALIEAGVVSGRFRAEAMARFASGDAPGSDKTLIEGVFRVPPGHVLIVDETGHRLERYWRYPVERRWSVPDDHTTAARALRGELEAAVRRALPERGPVATHLSGGLDSSAVAALAVNLDDIAAADVTAYCVALPQHHREIGAMDEEPPARAVAKKIGVTLVPVHADVVSSMLQRPLATTFPGTMDPEDGLARLLSHAASTGADRVLCGFGGDEVVSNNGRGAVLGDFLALRWRSLGQTARELSEPLWRVLARQAVAELLPHGLNRRIRRVVGAPPMAARPVLRTLRPEYRSTPRWSPSAASTVRIQRARLETGSFVGRLEMQAWEAARHGLRYVFPLLDWRLLEFAAGIPAGLQFHGGMRRALFRSAVADLLPREIAEQPRKLAPTPTTIYQLALDKPALIAEVRRLKGSTAASAVIDLDEIERQLESLPPPEEIAAVIRARAEAGEQHRDLRTGLIPALTVARALAANEAACRRREMLRPEAA